MLAFLAHAVSQGFIKARQIDALVIADDVDELLIGLLETRSDEVSAREGRDPTGSGRTGQQQHVAQLVDLAPVGEEIGH